MFFRRRYWFTIKQLQKYSTTHEHIEYSLKKLYKLGFLKSDEDALYENDFERLHELFENMLFSNVKQFEDSCKKIIRGNVNTGIVEKDYHLIMNNSYHLLKSSSEGDFKSVTEKVCSKVSKFLKDMYEEHVKTGKKINPHLAFLISDKYKLIN